MNYETTQDFLNQLDRLTFIKYDNKTLYTLEGFEISYSLELIGVSMPSMPIQFLLKVRKDNVHVTTWGCDGNESVVLSVKWWQKKEWEVYLAESEFASEIKKSLKKEFENLTKTTI
jgi:hypothetical protein